jgi:asparagine synthase (glutamine-hydrolysing)
MCGWVGLAFCPDANLRARLPAALTTIAHRGPDGEGMWTGDDVALGFRRLAIIDLNSRSDQPMVDPETGTVLIFNGEIYNYKELRADLESAGVSFRTTSDTEVLQKAYLYWGPAAFERMNGMWALAIWHPEERRLFLCRDRFGVKPLYYAWIGDGIAFASEPKALLALDPTLAEPDRSAIARLFVSSESLAGEDTYFRRIRSVPPASWAVVEGGGEIRLTRFWSYPEAAAPSDRSPPSAQEEEFDALLRSAVALRFRSDVPVGLTLSGGLDSTAILAATPSESLPAVRAFTATFEEGADEFDWASSAASQAGVTLVPVNASSRNWLEKLRQITWHMDAPGSSPPVFPLWNIMAKARADGVPVLLEGQGADELLGGYVQYGAAHLLERLAHGHAVTAARHAATMSRTFGISLLAKWVGRIALQGQYRAVAGPVGPRLGAAGAAGGCSGAAGGEEGFRSDRPHARRSFRCRAAFAAALWRCREHGSRDREPPAVHGLSHRRVGVPQPPGLVRGRNDQSANPPLPFGERVQPPRATARQEGLQHAHRPLDARKRGLDAGDAHRKPQRGVVGLPRFRRRAEVLQPGQRARGFAWLQAHHVAALARESRAVAQLSAVERTAPEAGRMLDRSGLDIEPYRSGEILFGDDFDEQAVAEWYEAEKLGYFDLSEGEDRFAYKALNGRHFFGRLAGQKLDVCLALGCAQGADVAALAPSVDRFIAVEPAQEWWSDSIGGKPATYLMPKLDGSLPIESGTVDCATAFGVLHHIPNVTQVLKEVARVLRPGALLFVREPASSMGDWREPRRGVTLQRARHSEALAAGSSQGDRPRAGLGAAMPVAADGPPCPHVRAACAVPVGRLGADRFRVIAPVSAARPLLA